MIFTITISLCKNEKKANIFFMFPKINSSHEGLHSIHWECEQCVNNIIVFSELISLLPGINRVHVLFEEKIQCFPEILRNTSDL